MTLTERLFAIASFAVLSLAFIPVLSPPGWAVNVLIGCGLAAAVLLTGGALLERRRRRLAAARRRAKAPGAAEADAVDVSPPGTLRRQWPALVDSQRIMGKPGSALLVAAVQTCAWLIQLGAALVALYAFHLGAAGLRGAALVLVLTNLIGLVPMTPGNLGTFQAGTAAALAVWGIAAGPAVAYGLGLQAMQLLVAAVAGLASLALQDLTLGALRPKNEAVAAYTTAGR